MKRIGVLVATTTALLATLMTAPAGAQQAAPGNDPHHPAPPAGTAPAPPAPAPGAPPAGMPMPMCHQMMADMAAMPMMRGGGADARERAEMLQMRGEMMKAMGDVMLKHARRMQAPAGK
jgi:hypothetical protein